MTDVKEHCIHPHSSLFISDFNPGSQRILTRGRSVDVIRFKILIVEVF
jgi:hypothetical protein